MDLEKCKILLEALDSRTIGKGLMGLLITSWTIKKLYTKIKIRRNIKIIEIKRKEIAKRKKSLEERYNPSILLCIYSPLTFLSLLIDGILLTKEREDILKKDIVTLLEELRNGSLKPLEVLEAYQAKSLVVDRDINAVCDYITEARDWARELESIPVEDRGALYGLPISVKVICILSYVWTNTINDPASILSGVFLRGWV